MITHFLAQAIHHHASDIHLSVGAPPFMRVDGDLRPIEDSILTNEELVPIIEALMGEKLREDFHQYGEADFCIELNSTRLRVNAFKQRLGVAAVLRIIPPDVLSLEQLALPDILQEISLFPQGLVLVTGPTGCGKSTTMAAMIDYINAHSFQHILTIEDPIEFIHRPKNCLINQREVHRDTQSMHAALYSALREDPDIILMGELRDQESMRLAMRAAETGHLVLASMHAQSACKAVHRIMSSFPGDEQAFVRSLLAESLQAVLAQKLVKKVQEGRVAVVEIMICTPAIRHLIREDKIAQIHSVVQTNAAKGMQTFEQHWVQLEQKGIITQRFSEY